MKNQKKNDRAGAAVSLLHGRFVWYSHFISFSIFNSHIRHHHYIVAEQSGTSRRQCENPSPPVIEEHAIEYQNRCRGSADYGKNQDFVPLLQSESLGILRHLCRKKAVHQKGDSDHQQYQLLLLKMIEGHAHDNHQYAQPKVVFKGQTIQVLREISENLQYAVCHQYDSKYPSQENMHHRKIQN